MAADLLQMDRELDGDPDDILFLDTLKSLKNRNSLHLQQLSSYYATYCAQPRQSDQEQRTLHENYRPQTRQGVPKEWLCNDTAKPQRSRRVVTVTVPQPFQMSLREEKKREKMRGQAWVDPVDDQSEEDLECYKQFRAQPVPAHVLLPLYNDIVENQEERRKEQMEKRKEELVSMQKPFHFQAQERKKLIEQPEATEKTQSIVKTIPKCVLDPSFSDRLKEKEVLRRISSQMRALDLLQSSCAPIRLTRHSRDPHSRSSRKSTAQNLSFLQQSITFHPHVNHAVPDFQALYRNFQKQSLQKYSTGEATKTKPFHLHTSQSRPKPPRVTSNQEEAPPTVTSSQHLSSLSANTLPVYITDSTKRREAAIRSFLQERDEQVAEIERKLQKQRQTSQAMQSSISHRARTLDKHAPLAECNKHKLRENLESNRRRSREYKKELQRMQSRVRGRAYLFEQVAQVNQRTGRKAELPPENGVHRSSMNRAELTSPHTLREAEKSDLQRRGSSEEESEEDEIQYNEEDQDLS
ncbi:protein FAM161B isoform X2 [Hyperolius riggenbachi]|uniref:protein FAM161B isoform X2 n=1 Tax=Hyperolius riggenbachi TaxID=752182 RepID=UPI0035A33203